MRPLPPAAVPTRPRPPRFRITAYDVYYWTAFLGIVPAITLINDVKIAAALALLLFCISRITLSEYRQRCRRELIHELNTTVAALIELTACRADSAPNDESEENAETDRSH